MDQIDARTCGYAVMLVVLCAALRLLRSLADAATAAIDGLLVPPPDGVAR